MQKFAHLKKERKTPGKAFFFPSPCVDVGKVSHPCDAFPGKESGGIKNGASKKGEKECGNEIVTQYICQCIMYQRTNVLSHKQDVTCVLKDFW